MSAEEILTILAIVVLSFVLIIILAIITGAVIIKRKLSKLSKLKLMSAGTLPMIFKLLKFAMRRKRSK